MTDSVFLEVLDVPIEYEPMCHLKIRDGEQYYQWNFQDYADAAVSVSYSFGEYSKVYVRDETKNDKRLIHKLNLCGVTFDTYKNGNFEKYEKRLLRMNDKTDAYIDVGMGGGTKGAFLCVHVYADGEVRTFKSRNVLMLAYIIKADYSEDIYNMYIDSHGVSFALMESLTKIGYKVTEVKKSATIDLDKLEEGLEDKMKIET